MDCPQCGGTLATYALSGREASVCEDCGYVGIAAEHRGDPRSVESWDDALRRFYRAHGHDDAPSVDLQPPLSRPSGSVSESWDDALRRFYARQTGSVDDVADDPAVDGMPPEQSAADAAEDDEDADETDEDADETDEDADETDEDADVGADTADSEAAVADEKTVGDDGTADDADDAAGVEADAGGR